MDNNTNNKIMNNNNNNNTTTTTTTADTIFNDGDKIHLSYTCRKSPTLY